MPCIPQVDDESQRLCTRCGLCCDGTLFAHAGGAGREELPPAIDAHFRWFTRKGTTKFELPCTAFDGCCTLYSGPRPRVCGAFKCKLLKRSEAGTTGWASAHQTVAQALALRDRVAAKLDDALGPDDAPRSLRQRMAALYAARPSDETEEAFRRRHATLLVEYAALRMHLTAHFYPNAKPAGSMAGPA